VTFQLPNLIIMVRQVVRACFLAIFLVHAAYGASLGTPTVGFGLNGNTASGQKSPLNDFSFLVQFSETVQQGGGTTSVQVTTGTATADVNRYINCNIGVEYRGSKVHVPIKQELKSAAKHTVVIPSTCFKNVGGESMTGHRSGYDFTTITKGSSILSYDTVIPTSFAVVPASGSYVSAAQTITMYFTEGVQSGAGSASITKAKPGGSAASFDTTPGVVFDASIPGKVVISHKSFDRGAWYAMSYTHSTFRDIAGNCVPAMSGYYVMVGSTITGYYPTHLDTTNVTKYTNLQFNFSDPILAGTTGLSKNLFLCKGWSSSNACTASSAVGTAQMHFLYDMVIINPAADMTPATQYNISMPSTLYRYYAGMSTNSALAWSYTFTVEAATASDTAPPLLFAGKVDCNGDDSVLGSCAIEGTTFTEVIGKVDATTKMLTTAKFKLYFAERVQLTSSRAVLTGSDGTSATLTPSVGTSESDCVVTLAPNMAPGKLYTLSVGAGVVVDQSVLKNPYAGTSFSFYTPYAYPTAMMPAVNSVNVARTTSLKISFPTVPLLGLTPTGSIIDLADGSVVQSFMYNDVNSVKMQGTDMVVMPNPILAYNKTYMVTLPALSIRYMALDFSYGFSTRLKDVTGPFVEFAYPTGVVKPATLAPMAPYMLLSESVSLTTGFVHIKKGGKVEYTIATSDTNCGSKGDILSMCVELQGGTTAHGATKVLMYPKGKSTGGASAFAWSTVGESYTVEIEAGSYTDAVTTGKPEPNLMTAGSFTFSANADIAGPTIIPASSVPNNNLDNQPTDMTMITLLFNELLAELKILMQLLLMLGVTRVPFSCLKQTAYKMSAPTVWCLP
jgi:methionine-rich copper-binding protein CopC